MFCHEAPSLTIRAKRESLSVCVCVWMCEPADRHLASTTTCLSIMGLSKGSGQNGKKKYINLKQSSNVVALQALNYHKFKIFCKQMQIINCKCYIFLYYTSCPPFFPSDVVGQ